VGFSFIFEFGDTGGLWKFVNIGGGLGLCRRLNKKIHTSISFASWNSRLPSSL